MILCHCNVITRTQIDAVVDDLMTEDRYRVITPGVVYQRLGKRGRCCGCFPQVIDAIGERMTKARRRTKTKEPWAPRREGELK